MGKFKTFLKVLLSLAVLAVVVVAVLWLVNFLGSPQGLYVSYNGVAYGNTALGSSAGGCVIPYRQAVTFTVGNANGWGVYSVQDCVVKVIPNVDDAHDFEFTVNGATRPSVHVDGGRAYRYGYFECSLCRRRDGRRRIFVVRLSVYSAFGDFTRRQRNAVYSPATWRYGFGC